MEPPLLDIHMNIPAWPGLILAIGVLVTRVSAIEVTACDAQPRARIGHADGYTCNALMLMPWGDCHQAPLGSSGTGRQLCCELLAPILSLHQYMQNILAVGSRYTPLCTQVKRQQTRDAV